MKWYDANALVREVIYTNNSSGTVKFCRDMLEGARWFIAHRKLTPLSGAVRQEVRRRYADRQTHEAIVQWLMEVQ